MWKQTKQWIPIALIIVAAVIVCLLPDASKHSEAQHEFVCPYQDQDPTEILDCPYADDR